jgi:DNA-binding response OmpR family regulator
MGQYFGQKKSIVILEGGPTLQLVIRRGLSLHYDLLFCSSLTEFAPYLNAVPTTQKTDAFLLDGLTPAKAFTDFLVRTRSLYPHAPIIILAQVDRLDETQSALELGADDFVVRSPHMISELLIRLPLNIFRRAEAFRIESPTNSYSVSLPQSAEEVVTASNFRHFVRDAEITYLHRALTLFSNNATALSRALEIGRTTTFRKLRSIKSQCRENEGT